MYLGGFANRHQIEFLKKVYTEVMILEYCTAVTEQTEEILALVQKTITTVYPKYYPKEIVDFFCGLHNRESITRDIENGNVRVLLCAGRIVGTGSYEEDHVTRVYVNPDMQGQGYGRYIMQKLENEIAPVYDRISLETSLSASRFYKNYGYRTVKRDKIDLENGVVLAYETMQKRLPVFRFTMDRKDYDPAGGRFRRTAVRGIIKKEDAYAMVYSAKYGEYKFPGGGREEGESLEDTLVREVQEETGLAVRRDSVRYAGRVEEIRKGKYDDIFEMTSHYFFCHTEEELRERHLSDYEEEEGYELIYRTLQQAIASNDSKADRANLPWLDRDTAVMELLREQKGRPGAD